jgi:hypothetical protein
MEAILPDLASDDFARREAGQTALAKLAPEHYADVMILVNTQTNLEVKARLQKRAAEMLDELLRSPTPASTRALIALLSERDGEVRNRSIGALTNRMTNSAEKGGSDELVPALAKALPDVKNESYRVGVCTMANYYLTPMKGKSAPPPDEKRTSQMADLLRERLKNDPSGEVRFWAACALAELGDNTGIPELEKDALAMRAAGDGMFHLSDSGGTTQLPWVDALIPAMEKVTGQKFVSKPINPNDPSIMLHGDMERQRMERKAKLEVLVTWINTHPATVPAGVP